MHEERFERFMNKTSYNETEKVIKAFIKAIIEEEEYSSIGLPIFLLDAEGNVDGTLFLSTRCSDITVRSKIKEMVGPDFDVKVKAGERCCRGVIYLGFWVDIERKEKHT